MGRSGRVSGTRELVIPKTPFVVPYRLQRNVIQILRVYHGARWLKPCRRAFWAPHNFPGGHFGSCTLFRVGTVAFEFARARHELFIVDNFDSRT